MGTHAVAFAQEEEGVTLHDEAGAAAGVAALGDIGYLTALGADQTDVGVGVVAVADEFKGEPLAVGAPGVVEAAVRLIPGGTVSDLTYLAGGDVEHHQAEVIFDEGQLFAVGAEAGVVARYLI